jgi:hypothetical protein
MQSNKENDRKFIKYDKEASGHVTVLKAKITGLLKLEGCFDVGKYGL